MHRKTRFLVNIAWLVASPAVLAQSAFDATARGTECRATSGGSLHCIYRVGKDLEFSITAIGAPDSGVSFLRSNIKGDFYARFGIVHGCIIVTFGDGASPKAAGDYAFVSPRTGRVYRSWQECQAPG